MLNKDKVLEVLAQVNDPELHRSLIDLKMVSDVGIHDSMVDVTIALTPASSISSLAPPIHMK